VKEPADARQIARAIREHDDFLLLGHVNPDGDVVGSLLALGSAMRELGKTARLIPGGQIPLSVSFLPGAEELIDPQPPPSGIVVVALDCTDPGRLPDGCRDLQSAALVLNVDHHACNKLYGDLNYVDPTAVAVGELVFYILQELGVPVDPARAACLYAAMATDSGMFRYEGTSPRTHRIVAELLELGVNPREMAERLMQTRSFEEAVLLGRALASLRRSDDGRVAWMVLRREDLTLDGRLHKCPEGCVDYARDIVGVEAAACLREREDGVRVSLRSRGTADVNSIAAGFGGGGHARAAGCTLHQPLEQAEQTVVRALREAVR